MKVRELIEKLQQINPDSEVMYETSINILDLGAEPFEGIEVGYLEEESGELLYLEMITKETLKDYKEVVILY